MSIYFQGAGSTGNYFQGFGEQAHSFRDLGSPAKKNLTLKEKPSFRLTFLRKILASGGKPPRPPWAF